MRCDHNRLPVHPLRAAEDSGYGSPEIRHTSVYSDRHRRHLCGGMGHGHGWLVERIGRFHGRHDPLSFGVRLSDQGVSLVDKGLLLSVFFIAIGMSINLKEVIGIGSELFYYLPSLLLLKVAVVIALGLFFRLGFRASSWPAFCWRPLMKSPTSSFPTRTQAVC